MAATESITQLRPRYLRGNTNHRSQPQNISAPIHENRAPGASCKRNRSISSTRSSRFSIHLSSVFRIPPQFPRRNLRVVTTGEFSLFHIPLQKFPETKPSFLSLLHTRPNCCVFAIQAESEALGAASGLDEFAQFCVMRLITPVLQFSL